MTPPLSFAWTLCIPRSLGLLRSLGVLSSLGLRISNFPGPILRSCQGSTADDLVECPGAAGHLREHRVQARVQVLVGLCDCVQSRGNEETRTNMQRR